MENKNGQGIFYGVIGVATLVVAIIGATFAYFSAAANTEYTNPIGGSTLDVGGSNLSLTVERVSFSGKTAGISDNLVPAVIDETNLASSLSSAVSFDCENGKNDYTGCHVYKVTANSTSKLNGVTVEFSNMKVTPANATGFDASNWKYAIYQGADEKTVTTLNTETAQAFSTAGTSFQVLDGSLTAETGTLNSGNTVWYLIVYLKNTDNPQNNAGENATNETGSYSGEVNLSVAGGGQVKATFSA